MLFFLTARMLFCSQREGVILVEDGTVRRFGLLTLVLRCIIAR